MKPENRRLYWMSVIAALIALLGAACEGKSGDDLESDPVHSGAVSSAPARVKQDPGKDSECSPSDRLGEYWEIKPHKPMKVRQMCPHFPGK